MTLVAGAALAVFAFATAGRNHFLAFLVSGAPFMTTGAVAVLASFRDAKAPPA